MGELRWLPEAQVPVTFSLSDTVLYFLVVIWLMLILSLKGQQSRHEIFG